MNKIINLVSVFFLVLVIATSCEKEQLVLQLSIQGYLDIQTRANDSGFENGDQVGIYVVDNVDGSSGTLSTTANHANNVKFTYSTTDNIWTPVAGSEIYWNDSKTKVDIYSYYPYSSSVGSTTEYPFSVYSEQSISGNYYKSDFLWAKASSVTAQTNPVNLYFGHKMSKIVITTTAGAGFTESEFNAVTKSVQILGTKLSSKINLSNGAVSVDNNTENGIIVPKVNGNVFTAVLVPQTIVESTVFLNITVNGVEYYYSKGFTFESNKQYNFTVSVNKNSLSVVSNSVSEWTSDGNVYSTKEEAIIKDFEGNIYTTVKIGTQTWMAENLKTTKYNDGTAIPNVTDFDAWVSLTTPAYCWYNNSKTLYGNTYGGLYNWYSVNTGKICPTGWHIPNLAEVNTLINYLGGVEVAGGKLKETGTSHWPNPNIASNESNFTALPGGFRANNAPFLGFEGVRGEGYWWTNSGSISFGYSEVWVLQSPHDNISTQNDPVHYGHSIRCLKD